MEPNEDRKTAEEIPFEIVAERDPGERDRFPLIFDPGEQIKGETELPALTEWVRPGELVSHGRGGELAPFVEIKNDEIAQAVKYIATKGGEIAAVGVYFVAVGVVAIVKYTAIGVSVFVVELVKVIFRLSRQRRQIVADEDVDRPQDMTKTGINVTTNVVGNVAGNVNINTNIHIR